MVSCIINWGGFFLPPKGICKSKRQKKWLALSISGTGYNFKRGICRIKWNRIKWETTVITLILIDMRRVTGISLCFFVFIISCTASSAIPLVSCSETKTRYCSSMTRLARSPAEQREMADRSEQEDGGTRPNNCRHAQTHGPEPQLDPDPLHHWLTTTRRYRYMFRIALKL